MIARGGEGGQGGSATCGNSSCVCPCTRLRTMTKMTIYTHSLLFDYWTSVDHWKCIKGLSFLLHISFTCSKDPKPNPKRSKGISPMWLQWEGSDGCSVIWLVEQRKGQRNDSHIEEWKAEQNMRTWLCLSNWSPTPPVSNQTSVPWSRWVHLQRLCARVLAVLPSCLPQGLGSCQISLVGPFN